MPRAPRVAVIARSAAGADAAGVDIAGILEALVSRGTAPQVLTATGEARLAAPVMHYADAPFLLDRPDDVVLFHHSGADPEGLATVRRLGCRVVVRCLGEGPAGLVSRYSPELGRAAQAARAELAELAELRVESFLAASNGEAAALREAGVAADRIQLVPPFHGADDLVGEPDEASVIAMLRRNAYTVLAVGDLSPEHGMDVAAEQLLDMLAANDIDIHLHHIGSHDARLQAFINRVGSLAARPGRPPHVTLHGQVTRTVAATLYRHCHAFWAGGGPWAPVQGTVTALAFAKPVLATPTAASRAACGDAALYTSTAYETAEALAGLADDDLLRVRLGRAARARYMDHWRPAVLRRRFLRRFDRALARGSVRAPAATLPGDAPGTGTWFGLPRHRDLVRAALPLLPPMPPFGLSGRDRRLDLVDWVLRDGAAASPWIAAYLAGDDFQAYARELDVPNAASHFGTRMRLLSTFHLPAICRFDLSQPQGRADFHQWFEQEGERLYDV